MDIGQRWIMKTVCVHFQVIGPATEKARRPWACCRQLDDVWRTVVDYERRHSRPACRSRTRTTKLSDAGNEMVLSLNFTRWDNEVCCGECQSVRGRTSVFRWRHEPRRWAPVAACLWWLLETRRARRCSSQCVTTRKREPASLLTWNQVTARALA